MCSLQNGIGGYYNPCITNDQNDENNGIKNVEDRHHRNRRRTTVSHSWNVFEQSFTIEYWWFVKYLKRKLEK